MSLSRNQQQSRAADPAHSAWVSANAGSGKTRVLTNRVARLLLGRPSHGLPGADPAKILCLTYTKVAAAEMQNRLFETLGKWALMADEDLLAALRDLLDDAGEAISAEDLPEARRLFAKALETPGGLKIQTIHAFCERLLRRFPVEAGLSPHFTLIDERESAQLLSQARDAAMAALTVEAPETAAILLNEMTETGLESLAFALLGEREAAEKALRAPEAVSAALGLGERMVSACEAQEFLVSGLLGELIKKLAALLAESPNKTDYEAAALLTAPGPPAQRVSQIRRALLTAKGEPRKKFPTKKCPGDPAFLGAAVARLYDALRRIDAAGRAEKTCAALAFAKRFYAAYDHGKRARGALDFADLILAARNLLTRSGAAAWVLYKLDGGVDHILVDEAQDTSPDQWTVIRALADEFLAGEGAREHRRTIFAVGDEKQSIYSFQGADPAEFARQRDHFAKQLEYAEQQLEVTPLEVSYRSAPEILAFVDRVFAPAAAAEGLGEGGARHEAYRRKTPGRVDLWPVVLPASDEEDSPWWTPVDQPAPNAPPVVLARAIADQIKEWLDKQTTLPARGRPIRPGDILILVRSRKRGGFVARLVSELKAREVPVAGRDRMTLSEELAAKDLLALARFALLPEDDLTLATVLRSPLIDLSEEALFDLAHGRRGHLWAALRQRRGERTDFTAAYAFLSDMLDQADFLRPYEFLEHALIGHDGRRRLLTRLGREAADPIDELLSLALAYENNAAPSLQGFLAYAEAGDVEIKREMAAEADAVRVMTVHGAKGLEANIVFLPDTCGDAGRNLGELWPVEEAVIWAPNKAADTPETAARREAKAAAEAAEERRLLYVALTRASDWLILCGHAGVRGPKPGCWHELASAAMADWGTPIETPLLGPDNAPLPGLGRRGLGEVEAERAKPAPPPVAPARWDWPAAILEEAEQAVKPSSADQDEAPEALAPSRPSESAAARRGTLLHRALEVLSEAPPGVDPGAAVAATLAAEAPDVSDADRAVLAETLAKALDTPGADWVFAPGGLSEVPVSGAPAALAGMRVTGIIDRLVVTPEAARIVDFKSGAPHDEIPHTYIAQLALYAAVLAEIYPGREISGHILWLDAARIDAAAPAELIAAQERLAAAHQG